MFSVFLPVRNGWPYVQECVQSILGQNYSDLELVVLDNASTDGTTEWLAQLTDPRVRIVPSDGPLSITENWARILAEPKRQYMTLIGHDDVLEPTFLETIKSLIDAHPDAGLFQTGGRLINANGGKIRACRPEAATETPADYLRARFSFQRDVFGSGYVMPSVNYDRVGGIPPFERLLFADDALWLSLMLGSYKAYAPSEQFGVRIHTNSESASMPSAWRPLLQGLGQLKNFLGGYAGRDADAAAVIARLGDEFQLAYHQNALIFALVEASLAGKRIPDETMDAIAGSLEVNTGLRREALMRAPKVRALSLLNASPMRGIVGPLWKLYYQFRHRAR